MKSFPDVPNTYGFGLLVHGAWWFKLRRASKYAQAYCREVAKRIP